MGGGLWEPVFSEKDVLCVYNDATSTYLRRFNFLDGRIAGIVESGASLSLKIAQRSRDFLSLGASTRVYYKACFFAIVEATNQNNITNLKLIKLY